MYIYISSDCLIRDQSFYLHAKTSKAPLCIYERTIRATKLMFPTIFQC